VASGLGPAACAATAIESTHVSPEWAHCIYMQPLCVPLGTVPPVQVMHPEAFCVVLTVLAGQAAQLRSVVASGVLSI